MPSLHVLLVYWKMDLHVLQVRITLYKNTYDTQKEPALEVVNYLKQTDQNKREVSSISEAEGTLYPFKTKRGLHYNQPKTSHSRTRSDFELAADI